MRIVLIGLLVNCFSLVLTAQAQREFTMTEGDTSYTMKRYVFVFLNAGPQRDQDSTTVSMIQEQHLAHLNTLVESGKLVVAGPFQDGEQYRGILIFDVDSIAEALQLEGEDPAVKSGRLEMKALHWWGAKGTVLP